MSHLCDTELSCLLKAGFRHFLQPLLCSTELPLVPIVWHRAFLPVQNLVPAFSLAVLRHRASPVPIVQHRALLLAQCEVPALSPAVVVRHRASYVTQGFPCPDCVTQSFAACSMRGSGSFPSRCCAAQSFACTDYVTQSFPACSKQGSGSFPNRCCVAQSFPCPDCAAQSFPACSKPGSGSFPGCFETQSFPLSRLCSTELHM